MTTSNINKISANSFKQQLESGQIKKFLDVRTPVEHAQAHLIESVLIPIDTLANSNVREQFPPEQPIYIMCQGGGRALRAAEQLSSMGYTNCYVVEGGMGSCATAGINIQQSQGAPVLPLVRQVHIIIGFFCTTGGLLSLLVSPLFAWIPLLMGAGLFMAGATGFCGLALLLAKMPWNQVKACSISSKSKDNSCSCS